MFNLLDYNVDVDIFFCNRNYLHTFLVLIQIHKFDILMQLIIF
jgi:hypothetical protein